MNLKYTLNLKMFFERSLSFHFHHQKIQVIDIIDICYKTQVIYIIDVLQINIFLFNTTRVKINYCNYQYKNT